MQETERYVERMVPTFATCYISQILSPDMELRSADLVQATKLHH